MEKDSYTTMVMDGQNIIRVLESVPEDKRPMLAAIFGAYLDGWTARERMSETTQLGA